jgi:hypothetical protein
MVFAPTACDWERSEVVREQFATRSLSDTHMIRTAFGLPVISRTWTRVWEGLFASRSAGYIWIVLIAALVAYAYELRTYTIFACPADRYSSDRYIAYCNGVNYADYEHGAFEFDLEPSVQDFVHNADVLFLGSSRLQVAFSTVATADWFTTAAARYYLMGFGYFENVVFTESLLRKIHRRARVYIINVDDFFDRSETTPAKAVLHDPEARHRYEVKRLWQRVHEPICKTFALLCGHQAVIFRSRETGAYYREGGAAWQHITPVSYDEAIDQKVVSSNTAAASDFLSEFAEGKCVILTNVPFVGTKIGNANAIAAGVGMELVTPGDLEDLQTFDGYHLDRPSAERWSRSFFQIAGPRMRSCLDGKVAAPARSSL